MDKLFCVEFQRYPSVRTNHSSGHPKWVKTAQGRVKLTHQLSDQTEYKYFVKKDLINQLFMRLQQQSHSVLKRWIPSRKQPFWCTCSVVHDEKELSIFVWSPAVNAVSGIVLTNHGPVSRGLPVNGSTAHKPTTTFTDKQVSEFVLSIETLSLT